MKRFCAVSPSVCLVLALVSDPRAAEAAFERQVSGGRSAGMGSAIVTGSPDAWSATVHSALLGFVHRPSIESQVQPSPFGPESPLFCHSDPGRSRSPECGRGGTSAGRPRPGCPSGFACTGSS